MLIFNYDAKPIEDIERKLDNLSLLGLAVVRINMSNVLPSESTTLVDVLAQNRPRSLIRVKNFTIVIT